MKVVAKCYIIEHATVCHCRDFVVILLTSMQQTMFRLGRYWLCATVTLLSLPSSSGCWQWFSKNMVRYESQQKKMKQADGMQRKLCIAISCCVIVKEAKHACTCVCNQNVFISRRNISNLIFFVYLRGALMTHLIKQTGHSYIIWKQISTQ